MRPQDEAGKVPILWVPGQAYSFQQSYHPLRFLHGAGSRVIAFSYTDQDVKVFRPGVAPDKNTYGDSLLAVIDDLKLAKVNVIARLEPVEDIFRAVLRRPYGFKNIVIVMPPDGRLDPGKSSEIVDRDVNISLIYEPYSSAVFSNSAMIQLVVAVMDMT